MSLPTWARFEIVNSISEREVQEAKFVIYAHVCSEGIYVGKAADPVSRWLEHVSYAFDKRSPYYADPFREAIRRCGPDRVDHYIVGVSDFEKSARDKEATAIKYYGRNLNAKTESEGEVKDFGFRPLKGQLGRSIVLKRKTASKAVARRNDSERKTVTAEIYLNGGRKRVRSLKNPYFPAGLNIECSRAEREKFNVGDKVRVNVALSEKNGTEFLIAGNTSVLMPVHES